MKNQFLRCLNDPKWWNSPRGLLHKLTFVCFVFLMALSCGLTTCNNKLLDSATGAPVDSVNDNGAHDDMPQANFYFLTNKVGDGFEKIQAIYDKADSDKLADIIFALGDNIAYSGNTIALKKDGADQPFCSKLYGNGFSITLNSGKALFAQAETGAMFRNIVINNIKPVSALIEVDGGKLDSLGILVGESEKTVEFRDVTIFGDIKISALSGLTGDFHVGGITGKVDSGTGDAVNIVRCAFLGTIDVENTENLPNLYAGGLVGKFSGAAIENSFAASTMDIHTSSSGSGTNLFVGGLCGTTGGAITNCYVNGSSATFGGNEVKVGGICATAGGVIKNCAALITNISATTATTPVVKRIAVSPGTPPDPAEFDNNYAFKSMSISIDSTHQDPTTDGSDGTNATAKGSRFGYDASLYFGLTEQGFYDTLMTRSETNNAILYAPLDPDAAPSLYPAPGTGWNFNSEKAWKWASNDWKLPIPANCPNPPIKPYYTPIVDPSS